MKEMPHMDHFRPDLEIHAYICGSRGLGQADGVVEQRFRRADLDQQRRKPGEIRIDRRR